MWLEELELRLAPASFAVNARLEISRLDSVTDTAGGTRAVVFFEAGVADYQVLRQGLDVGTDAVLLDSCGDGLQEMAAFLAGRHDLSTIGVVAHGSPGVIALGAGTLDAHSLGSYARQLAVVGAALAPAGELDLWSCSVAAGEAGEALVSALATATGAGVAASENMVGAAALGGAWGLGVRVAGARGEVPFSADALAGFRELLGGWSSAGSMVSARDEQTATLLTNGRVLIVGGKDNKDNPLASVELYDPISNTWSRVASLSAARYGHTATLLPAGKVLVTGGYNGNSVLASAELYDPGTNTWSLASPMTAARTSHSATLLANGQVLVTGGLGVGGTLSSAEVYDPASNSWFSAASMATVREFHTTTLLGNGKVLVSGGFNGTTSLAASELYDPIGNSWSSTPSLSAARYGHTATLLPGGKVLVAGGYSGSSPLGSAELYDPSSNSWSLTNPMPDARSSHTATLLGIGEVLLAGGFSSSAILSSAVVYNPLKNSWSPTSFMATARFDQTATLLGNGDVLITGGSTGSSFLASSELYNPAGADPFQSNVAVTPASMPSGSTATVTLTARDTAGNPLGKGGLSFSFGLGGGTGRGTFSNLLDHNDGTYTATFTATTAGAIVITATLNGQAITSALPIITVTPGPVSLTRSTVAVSSTRIAIGSAVMVTLTAKDSNGNQEASGGATFSFSLGTGSGSGTFSNLVDHNNGTYTASFTGTAAGTIQIIAFIAGQPLTSIQTISITPGSWSLVASLTTARAGQTATLLGNGKVLVTGGISTSGSLSSAELYDPALNTWSAAGAMAAARNAYAAILLGSGQVLVAGGFGNNGSLAGAELYDPVSNTWSPASSMVTARNAYTATLLGNGMVLVAGGVNNGAALASAELYDPAGNHWSPAGAMATARFGQTATLLGNGKVLVAGGYSDTSHYLASAELYDPLSNTWSAAGNMATARADQTATLLGNGRVLVAGGHGTSGVLSSAEYYDPLLNTWSAAGFMATARADQTATLLGDGQVLATGGAGSAGILASAELYEPISNTWSSAGSLATAREFQTATPLSNGNVLVAGGVGTSGTLATVELFNPGLANPPGAWHSATSLATPRDLQTATLLSNGKVLVIGGYNSGYLSSVELYDPISNTWSGASNMAAARYEDTATLLASGKVLVTGGYGTSGILSSAELYDPGTNTWTAAGTMAAARYAQTATLLANGKLLVTGGEGAGDVLSSAEIYDPVNNTWSSAGSMAVPRHGHTATLLANGKVLVTGGVVGNSFLASAEVYDPVSNTWSTASPMSTARSSPTATLLGNGRVLVTGGLGAGGVLSSAELYEPLTNTWSSAGAMASPRSIHTATLLASGQVLVTGGFGSSAFLASAELYDPIGNTWSAAASLATARYEHTATRLANGMVLITGGYGTIGGKGGALSSAELYNPAEPDPFQSTLTVVPASIQLGGTAIVTLIAKDSLGTPESRGGSAFSFGTGAGAGSGTFGNLTDNHNGTYMATFTGTALGPITITATLNNQPITSTLPIITVVPGPATYFRVAGPATATVGMPVAFTVTALNQNNYPAGSSYNGTVHFSSTDASASLPSNTVLSYGTGIFTATLNTLGAQAISVGDALLPGITGTSNLVAVSTAATQFAVTAPAAATAGSPVLVTVTAEDSTGHVVTGYSGTVQLTSTDGQALLPPSTTLANGTGSFLVTLKTAGGPWIITAKDTLKPAIAGASAGIRVSPGPASYFTALVLTGTQITGVAFNVTVTALDQFGNVATGYGGHVHFTSSDASASLSGDSPLTAGQGTFAVTLATGGTQTITVTDTSATNPTITGSTAPLTTRGLIVTSFTPTATGFTASFSKPFIPGDLTLYGGGLHTAQDVTLVGARVGAVTGSLIIDSSNQSVTFKATENSLLAFSGTAVLPDDTYTVTLLSGSGTNGFLDALAVGLDGASSGGHANYTSTFRAANSSKAILSIPDFARGPDGTHAIKVPNDSAGGIPVTLSNASNVQDVTFTLSYNPSLLAITGAGTGDASAAGSTFTLVATDPPPGTVTFSFHSNTPQSGTVVLGDILANVPDSAAGQYKSKDLLSFSSITVNGAPFAGVSAGGIHVNAYFGDVTGNGAIDGLDIATAGTLAQGTATGFAAYPLLDPAIVGDVANDISVDAGDVSDLAAFTVHLATPVIPPVPSGLTITPAGPDPTLSLGEPQIKGDKVTGTQGDKVTNPGDSVTLSPGHLITVPVLLDQPHPLGSTGMTEAILALTYDSAALTIAAADITMGSIPGSGTGWQLASAIDAALGQIGIELYSTTPITASQPGSLVNIAFHVVPGAKPSPTAVQLVNRVMPGGQPFTTQVDDAQGQLVLSSGKDRTPLLSALFYDRVFAQLADDRDAFRDLLD